MNILNTLDGPRYSVTINVNMSGNVFKCDHPDKTLWIEIDSIKNIIVIYYLTNQKPFSGLLQPAVRSHSRTMQLQSSLK